MADVARFDFDGAVLARAITATFENRKTAIDAAPIALTPSFSENAATLAQWRAFVRRSKLTNVPDRLADVATALTIFLGPVASGSIEGSFTQNWTAPGPWT